MRERDVAVAAAPPLRLPSPRSASPPPFLRLPLLAASRRLLRRLPVACKQRGPNHTAAASSNHTRIACAASLNHETSQPETERLSWTPTNQPTGHTPSTRTHLPSGSSVDGVEEYWRAQLSEVRAHLVLAPLLRHHLYQACKTERRRGKGFHNAPGAAGRVPVNGRVYHALVGLGPRQNQRVVSLGDLPREECRHEKRVRPASTEKEEEEEEEEEDERGTQDPRNVFGSLTSQGGGRVEAGRVEAGRMEAKGVTKAVTALWLPVIQGVLTPTCQSWR